MAAPIVLREYRTVTRSFDADDARQIHEAAPTKALTIRPSFAPGEFELTTRSWIGTLQCGTVPVLIKPKVSMRNVFEMLVPSIVHVPFGDDSFSYADDASFTDVMASVFARSSTALLRHGLRLGYRQEDEWLTTLRGRIDHGRQLRSPIPTPLACRYDEYSIDTDHHRLLRAAALRMLRFVDAGSDSRAMLARLVGHLGGVADAVPSTAAVLARGFSRLDAHYRPAVHLACLILDNSSVVDVAGGRSAATFLVDMNRVFEDYMTEMLRRAMPTDVELSGQYRTTLDVEGEVKIRPDLVLSRNGRPFGVADLKYIQPQDDTGKHANLYQVVSYCDALGVEHGTLIYVAEPGSEETTMTVRRSGKTIDVVRIDLSSGSDKLEGGVQEIATALQTGTDNSAPTIRSNGP